MVSGTVVYRGDHYGMLTIQDERGVNYICTHLSSTNLKIGDKVQKGKLVGRTGKTATISPHLHYEVAEKGFIAGALQNPSAKTKQDFRDRTRNPLKDYWEMEWNSPIV